MAEASNSDAQAGWELIFRSGDIPPRYRSFAEPNATVVEWADTLPAGSRVLDVGSGVGRHIIYLGGRGFKMAGMDISPTGIEMTRAACGERQIEFDGQVAPMTMIPWADMTFDAALSTSAIHHNRRADIALSLAEIWRVLKPGGLFMVDLLSKDRPDYQQLRHRAAAGEITEIEPDTFVDEHANADDSDDFLPHHFCDEAEARDLLRFFEIVRFWTETEGINRGRWLAQVRKPLTE